MHLLITFINVYNFYQNRISSQVNLLDQEYSQNVGKIALPFMSVIVEIQMSHRPKVHIYKDQSYNTVCHSLWSECAFNRKKVLYFCYGIDEKNETSKTFQTSLSKIRRSQIEQDELDPLNLPQ